MKINDNYELNVGATLVTIDSKCFNCAYHTSAFTEEEVKRSAAAEIAEVMAEGVADVVKEDKSIDIVEGAILGMYATKKMAEEAVIRVYRPSVDSMKSLAAALYELYVNGDSEPLDEYQKNTAKLPDEFVNYVKDLAL